MGKQSQLGTEPVLSAEPGCWVGGAGVRDGLSGGLFWIQQELFQKYQMFSDKKSFLVTVYGQNFILTNLLSDSLE